ncbi:MAG: tetratricopeptide repeat protein [Bryobacteraceae bacterium]
MRRFPALFFFLALLCPGVCAAQTYLVLPFFNHTGNGNLDWIGESLGENVRDTLAAEGLLTISREDRTEAYRRLAVRPYTLLTKATVMKMGEVLDAGRVIYGRFELKPGGEKVGSRGNLHITVQILDLGKLRAGPEYEALGALEDLAALQTHIAWQTLQFVKASGAPQEDEFRRMRPAVRVDAMEYYIRGLLAGNDEQKHRFFTQAARLDPGFAAPCFELGKMQWTAENYREAADWLQKVPNRDSHYREAMFFAGISRFYLGEYAAAQSAFETIVREVPLNEVHNNLGAAQSRRNLADAAQSFERALEGDPNDPEYLFNVGYTYWKRGDFDRAADHLRRLLQRDPDDQEATALLGRCLQKSGPRAGDTKLEGLERLKHEYNESAFLQLRSILESKKP